MPVNLIEPKAPDVVPEVAMPPPVSRRPELPLFHGLEDLRSRHSLRGQAHERMFHIVLALVGTGVVFGILYASMLFLE